MPSIGVLPVAGLALLVGVDRFMAEIRAATNLTSNIIATLVIGRWVGAVDNERAQAILDSGEKPEDVKSAESAPQLGQPAATF
jgi:Na+/H+-dicarboxylate symporter